MSGKYVVKYYECYTGTYEVDARLVRNEDEAIEFVKDGIREGRFEEPDTCDESGCTATYVKDN